jgi:hypothetical protein
MLSCLVVAHAFASMPPRPLPAPAEEQLWYAPPPSSDEVARKRTFIVNPRAIERWMRFAEQSAVATTGDVVRATDLSTTRTVDDLLATVPGARQTAMGWQLSGGPARLIVDGAYVMGHSPVPML